MVAWPKSILNFGADLLTARTAMRLRRGHRGVVAQFRTFRSLLRNLAAASHWKTAGVDARLQYEEFRDGIPLQTYESLAPAIRRMQQGESSVLWPGNCRLFAATAGTSGGSASLLPVTSVMRRHFRAGCRDALLYYTARTGHAGVLRGRHLFLTASTALEPLNGGAAGAYAGDWPALATLDLPRWFEERVFEPGAEIAQIAEWPAKVDAVISRTAASDISLVAGIPTWLLSFAETFRTRRAEAGQRVDTLQEQWPNLECILHTGVPLAPYQAELRAIAGSQVAFHEVYAAAEGIIAAQDTETPSQLRLMTDLGVFFEFIPFSSFDASRLESCGGRAVPLAHVQPGVDYVLLLTTPAGLARYVIGDIVRFSSVQPARLRVVGHVKLQLSAFDEHVLEDEVTEALVTVSQRHRWSIVNFHVAPLFGLNLTGQARGCHEWWIELRPGTVETPTGPQMAAELDRELQQLNPDYAERRNSGRIGAPTVRLVMPGVFRHWLKFRGKWGGQSKVARCRSDRLIADELAQITRFARD